MSPSPLRPKPRRASVATEEERAWISFYRRAGQDAALAAEVLAELDADVELKRMHLALYLSCRESLRTHALREARNARIGSMVRRTLHTVCVAAPRSMVRKLKHGGDIAAACLPEVDAEPAIAQVRRLASGGGAERSHAAFEPTADTRQPSGMSGVSIPAAEPIQARAAE